MKDHSKTQTIGSDVVIKKTQETKSGRGKTTQDLFYNKIIMEERGGICQKQERKAH